MADAEEEAVPGGEQQQQVSSSTGAAPPEPPDPRPAASPPEDAEDAEERPSEAPSEGGAARSRLVELPAEMNVGHFKTRKFFVLRPGTLNQAIKDTLALVNEEVDGSVRSIWLMAEVDHWNNEKERLVMITDNTLLVFKYDFIMLRCDQIQRIQLNYVDRISYGAFTFPKPSLLQREGEGLRVFWDRMREPSFISRWNPFATDFPFITLTHHPVRNVSDSLTALCDIHTFREQLRDAAQKGHALKPVPGKANGVLVLNQPIHIDAYVGVMSFLGNQNKLGYSMARGNIGF